MARLRRPYRVRLSDGRSRSYLTHAKAVAAAVADVQQYGWDTRARCVVHAPAGGPKLAVTLVWASVDGDVVVRPVEQLRRKVPA